jgi:glycine/serine hydroxymethyltransferase
VRIGTPALTTRGFKEADFVQVAHFLDRALQIALRIQVQYRRPCRLSRLMAVPAIE